MCAKIGLDFSNYDFGRCCFSSQIILWDVVRGGGQSGIMVITENNELFRTQVLRHVSCSSFSFS